jgi:serine/threonine protein kinase
VIVGRACASGYEDAPAPGLAKRNEGEKRCLQEPKLLSASSRHLQITLMETEFWNDIRTAGTATQPSDRDEEDPADLLSFVSNAYELDIPLIDTSSPNIQRWLGGGTSAAVHLFRLGHKQDCITGRTKKHWHLEADRYIALKRPTTLAERRSMLNELRILSHPPIRDHENITDILGWSVKADRWSVEPLLTVEASTYGDLSRFLYDGLPSSVDQATSISVDLTRGLHALHCARVIHGDIKSSNVLLFANSRDATESYRAKICDFGFSTIVSDYPKSKDRISLPRSAPYNAPECRPGAEILFSEAFQADVFSYGMVLWDIWSHGFVLKNDESELERKKQSGKLTNEIQGSLKTDTSLDHLQETVLCSILSACLQINPQQRIRDIIHLLPKLYAIASSTRGADKDELSIRSPINRDIVPGENDLEPLSRLAPVPADVS